MQVKGLQGDLQGLGQSESTKPYSGYQNVKFGEDGTEHKNNDDIVDKERILDC